MLTTMMPTNCGHKSGQIFLAPSHRGSSTVAKFGLQNLYGRFVQQKRLCPSQKVNGVEPDGLGWRIGSLEAFSCFYASY